MIQGHNGSIIVSFFMGLAGGLTIVAAVLVHDTGVAVSNEISSYAPPRIERKLPEHRRPIDRPSLPVAVIP